MVKLAKRGSQDPTDSSLQMKVTLKINLDKTIPCYGKKITNCTKKWPVITEPHLTPFQSLEQSFSTVRMKSEDLNLTCSEKTALDSPFSEPPEEPVKADTELSSRPIDQTLSSNDACSYLILLISFV